MMTRVQPRPFRIAGAGLSGLAAAITLARDGRRVEVHERGRGPGCRHHFDLQGIENWSHPVDVLTRLKRLGLEPDCQLYPVHEIHLLMGDLEDHLTRSAKPLAYLIRRGLGPGTLDDFMRRTAESWDIPIRNGSALGKEDADIWAAGPPAATGIVSGYTFRTERAFLCVCLLHEDYAPGGYVYLNIAGGHGTLATVLMHSFPKAKRCLEEAREALCSRFRFDMREERSFGGIGHFRLPSREPRHPLEVGEAGGFQDLLFGFGIYYALLTGCLAARSILERESYSALWHRELDASLRAGLANRLLFEMSGRFGFRYLIREATRSGPQAFLERWYRLSLAKRLLFPFARAWAGRRFAD
jgi:flavin-dependent dehydrogenase